MCASAVCARDEAYVGQRQGDCARVICIVLGLIARIKQRMLMVVGKWTWYDERLGWEMKGVRAASNKL